MLLSSGFSLIINLLKLFTDNIYIYIYIFFFFFFFLATAERASSKTILFLFFFVMEGNWLCCTKIKVLHFKQGDKLLQ